MLAIITYFHIGCGMVALLGAILALAARKGGKLHSRSGKTFTLAMLGIFISALLISLYEANTFLIFVALFSVYLAISGYLLAVNKAPEPLPAQRYLTNTAVLVTIFMLSYGGWMLSQQDNMGIVLMVFGSIIGFFAAQEIYNWRRNTMVGAIRLSAHLSRMLGGTIAILTASTIVNIEMEPEWLKWLLPTFALVPVIVYWNVKLLRN